MNFLILHERDDGPETRVSIENINAYRSYNIGDESEGTIILMKSETIYVDETVSQIDRLIVRAGSRMVTDPPPGNHPPRTNQEP